MSTIIAKNSKLLVDDNYLRVLIQEANKRLKRNQKKIKKLIVEFSAHSLLRFY